MRGLLVLVLAFLLGATGAGFAADTGNRNDKVDVWQDLGDHASDRREGGETVMTAYPIPSLPFADSGATCDNFNDYDEVCPYSGSTSPDVVYAYTPGADTAIEVDLCFSSYDTKVYIYEDYAGNLVACNDDFYFGAPCFVYSSKIDNFPVSAGHTYYIVIDGYGGSCGSYELTVIGGIVYWPCADCPPGSFQENEPACVDGYYDTYNGGCNTSGWTLIEAIPGELATVCGKSCTYLYQGSSYRDTDWFETIATGGLVEATCLAEFPLQFILIYGTDCANLLYDLTTAGTCAEANLSRSFSTNETLWLWVGASVFTGVPESNYVLSVLGIGGVIPPIATEEATWGRIKTRFR